MAWVKFKFARVKVCGVSVWLPLNIMMKKGRGHGMTWIEFDMGIDCVMGDLNGWIGNRVREGIASLLEFQVKLRMINLC